MSADTQPEPTGPTQCSGDEGFCPEHGFHRHSLKQPGDTEPETTAPSLREQLVTAIDGYPVACWTPGNLADRVLRIIGPELAAIDRVRKVIAERRTEVAERETDGMLPFGTPGASWCDAVTVTCDRIDDALKIHPEPVGIPCPPGHDSGPSVRECAANDRVWDLQKHGE